MTHREVPTMTSSTPHDHHGDHDEPPENGSPGHDGPGSGHGGGDGHGHNDPKSIEIVVVTTADDLDRKFDLDEPLRTVFERALKLVGGQAQPDQFALDYADEPLTQLDRKLRDLAHELGWGRRVVLELVPKPVVV
jgi:hypothetical protein